MDFISSTHRNVISTWSSGTGAAGVFGAVTYAGLLAIGISAEKTMLLMLVVPLLQALAFFALLRRPSRNCIPRSSNSSVASAASILESPVYYHSFDAPNPTHLLDNSHQPLHGIRNKLLYIPKLFKYILPLFFVYLFEYFINMGLVIKEKLIYLYIRLYAILLLKHNISSIFPVWTNLLPRNLAEQRISIPLAASRLSNRCIHLPFVRQPVCYTQHLADVDFPVFQHFLFHLWIDIHVYTVYLDHVWFCVLGRIAGRRLLREHILSDVARSARLTSDIRIGHCANWRLAGNHNGWTAGHTCPQYTLHASTTEIKF